MKKNLFLVIFFLVLLSLIPEIFSKEYEPLSCTESGYCYMNTKNENGWLTNDPKPTHSVLITPRNIFLKVEEQTYIKKGDVIVLKGDNFTITSRGVGGYDEFLYEFSPGTSALPSGEYTFSAVLKDKESKKNTPPYIFTDIIDIIPPSIDDVKLYQNKIIDKSNTKMIEESNNATIEVMASDNDGIADTDVVGVNISVANSSGVFVLPNKKMILIGNGRYSYEIGVLPLGTYTARFYAYDNLTNMNDSVSYTFNVSDVTGPGIYITKPINNMTAGTPANLSFLTSEGSICDLYYYKGRFINHSDYGTEHLFPGVDLNRPTKEQLEQFVDVITSFNISCQDAYNNPTSMRVDITLSTKWPKITQLNSSRGHYISSFYYGSITSLEVSTNIDAVCRYQGGIAPQEPPLGYDSMNKSLEGSQKFYTKDLTDELKLIDGYTLNKNYTYYAACRDEATGRTSPTESVNFTVNIAFAIIGKSPLDSINYSNVSLYVNTTWASFCWYKADSSDVWVRFDGEEEESTFYHRAALGVLNDGVYNYDIKCDETNFDSISFVVGTKPKPVKPVLWYLPSETDEQTVDVIGYANESNVTVHIGSAEYNKEPTYNLQKNITYFSNLKGSFRVINQKEDELIISKGAYDAVIIGDYVWFDTANLTYFKRYQIIDKPKWLDTYKIILFPSLKGENIVNKYIYIYDKPYPTGWFNISIQLIPEKYNHIRAYSVDYLGNEGGESEAGPVYFHIKPPFLYGDVPDVVGKREINISGGQAKAGSFISISNLADGEPVEEEVCTDSDGGRNYYVKGRITGPLASDPSSPREDICVDGSVRELFCNDEGRGEPVIYECPNGCYDGACVRQSGLIPTDENGDFSATVLLSPSMNIISARIVDQNGNPLSEPSNNLSIYYDNKGPNITITSPPLITNKQDVEVRADLKDYVNIARVDLSVNDTIPYNYSETPNTKEVSFIDSTPPLSRNGTYLIHITAEDRFGNVNSADKEFVLDTSMPDPPRFNLGGAIINYSSPALNFTFNEKVEVHGLGGIGYLSMNTNDNITFLFAAQSLVDGTYKISINASALKGGSIGEYPFNFTVDTINPKITIEKVDLIGTQTANISGRCGDANPGRIDLFVDGTQRTGDLFYLDCVNGSYKFENVVLGSNRSYTIEVRALDLAGNSNFTIRIVDTGIPKIKSIVSIKSMGVILEEPYKTSSDEVDMNCTYMEEDVDGVVVLVNEKPANYTVSIHHTGNNEGFFELNVELEGVIGQEVPNNITIILWDKAGLNDVKKVIVIRDMMGPGGCMKVGDNVYCISGSNGGGGEFSTTADSEIDFDDDGLPDSFEYKYFNCTTCAEPDADDDNDGINNLEEYRQGTIPVTTVSGSGGSGG